MSPALLDVNVLVALFDPFHVHHETAHQWFRSLRGEKWATCPLTINGCVRIMSQPGFKQDPMTPAEVAVTLHSLFDQHHDFWTDSISILDDTIFSLEELHSGRQLTDVYLLGLAVRRGGHLVTFDRSIPWRAVKGAKVSHLKILGSTGR